MSEREFKQMPCGRCNCGTYAYGAVLAGIEQYRGVESRREALRATPRCKTDPRHMCWGDRDFVMSATFPFTAEVEAKIMGEITL